MPCEEIRKKSSIQGLMVTCRNLSTHRRSPRSLIAFCLRILSPQAKIRVVGSDLAGKTRPRAQLASDLAVHVFDLGHELANRLLSLRTQTCELNPLPLLFCPHDDADGVND